MAQDNDSDTEDEQLSERQQRIKDNIHSNVHDIALNRHKILEGEITKPSDAPCNRCNDHAELHQLTVNGNTRYVCEDCAERIIAEIDDTYWFDRFTRSHYNIIAEFLRSLDPVWCVKDHAYQGGEMFIHTGHASTTVVSDVTDYLGGVDSLHVETADDSPWDCMKDHGDCIEILLDFGTDNVPINPIPTHVFAEQLINRSHYDVDYLDDESKFFSRDDE